jgi:hypothetical protein
MMRHNIRVVCSLASLFFVFAYTGGCQRNTSGTESIHGNIRYKGTPLTASSVTFFPASGRPVTAPAPEGEYTAELAPGEYTAAIAVGIEYPKGFKEGDPIPPPKVVLPAEYTSRAKSTLKAVVKAEQTEPIDFDLK